MMRRKVYVAICLSENEFGIVEDGFIEPPDVP